jgi:D-alanine-D-alanine ligase
MRVTILHNAVPPDAPPDEQDVLVQAAAVREALAGQGHAVEALPCDLDLAKLGRLLKAAPPGAVFNLVESLDGYGRLIHLVPDLLDTLGIRYAGCPAEALYITSNKLLAKRLLQAAGLPTPSWYQLVGGDLVAGGESPPIGARFIIKSVWEDASVGMDDVAVVTDDPAGLRRELASRHDAPGAPWFAELYVEGREFNISVLEGPDGPQVLPAAEMMFEDYPAGKPRIVGYAAKWAPDSFEYRHTRRRFDLPVRDLKLLDDLAAQARASWDLFGLHGWVRVDFRVDQAGQPWILEVNANPCLSPDAGFTAACARAGLAFDQAVSRILECSLTGASSAQDPD